MMALLDDRQNHSFGTSDSFIWKAYLDKMSGTLENIRDSKYIQKARMYALTISEIDPDQFEEPAHQKKVREVVLFIKDATKPDMTRTSLKPIVLSPEVLNRIENAKEPEPPVLVQPSITFTQTQVTATKPSRRRRNRRRGRKH